MIVPNGVPGGDLAPEGAEVLADTLADRLQGLEPRRLAGGMDADALGRAVVDGDKDRL